MLEVPLPRAPRAVDAIIAIRQVVMESASGIVMLATPSLSVMISGLMYSASGKYDRTLGAAPASSFSFTSVALFLVVTSAPVTSTTSFMASMGLEAGGGAIAIASKLRSAMGRP